MPGVEQQIYRGSGDVSAAASLPQASPDAFGAQVGASIEQLGNTLEQGAAQAMGRERQRQREVMATEAGAKLAQADVDVDAATTGFEQNAAPGAAGHVEAVSDFTNKRYAQVVDGIGDQHVRSEYQSLIADRTARRVMDAQGWAAGQRAAYGVNNIREAGDVAANRLMSNPDPAALGEELQSMATTIGAQGVSADVAEKATREQSNVIATGYFRGRIKTDPAAALLELGAQGGQAEQLLDPNSRAVLINGAESELRVQMADANRQHAQAVSQLHQDVEEYKQRVDRGELPKDEDAAALVTRAQSLGENQLVDDIGYDQGKAKLSRETDKWTPAEWEHTINTLAAKVASGKASNDEQIQLRVLQDLRGPKEARFRSDPDGYAAASGIQVPQVDLANPDAGTVQARKSWARSFARTAGQIEPPYLSKDQLQLYRQRAAQGPVGQLEVASELRNVWGNDAAPSIVRQIGGEGQGDLQIMLGLNDRMAQVYRRGDEALGKKSIKLDDKTIGQIWQQYAPGVPADVAPALFDTARKITAGWMSEQGKTEPTSDFANVFSQAIHRAAGMMGSVGQGSATGGLVNWNGRFAWLPQDMSRNDFQGRLSRAQPQDWLRAAVDARGNPISSAPHHMGPDGHLIPYKVGEAMRFGQGRLQTVAPGIFQLIDPAGGSVVDGQGRPWLFDVRRLPRGHFGGGR